MVLLPNSDLLAGIAQFAELHEGFVAKEEPRTPARHLKAARQPFLTNMLLDHRHRGRRHLGEGALGPRLLKDIFHLRLLMRASINQEKEEV